MDVRAESEKAIMQTDTIATDLIVQQLQQGLRGDGTELPDYSDYSVEVYGKPSGPIRLFDKGSFYRGINVKVVNGIMVFDSTDEKTEMLELRYNTGGSKFQAATASILALNAASKVEWIKDLQPALVGNVKEKLGL